VVVQAPWAAVAIGRAQRARTRAQTAHQPKHGSVQSVPVLNLTSQHLIMQHTKKSMKKRSMMPMSADSMTMISANMPPINKPRYERHANGRKISGLPFKLCSTVEQPKQPHTRAASWKPSSAGEQHSPQQWGWRFTYTHSDIHTITGSCARKEGLEWRSRGRTVQLSTQLLSPSELACIKHGKQHNTRNDGGSSISSSSMVEQQRRQRRESEAREERDGYCACAL